MVDIPTSFVDAFIFFISLILFLGLALNFRAVINSFKRTNGKPVRLKLTLTGMFLVLFSVSVLLIIVGSSYPFPHIQDEIQESTLVEIQNAYAVCSFIALAYFFSSLYLLKAGSKLFKFYISFSAIIIGLLIFKAATGSSLRSGENAFWEALNPKSIELRLKVPDLEMRGLYRDAPWLFLNYKGRTDEAIQLIQERLSNAPECRLYRSLAQIMEKQNDLIEARNTLEAAVIEANSISTDNPPSCIQYIENLEFFEQTGFRPTPRGGRLVEKIHEDWGKKTYCPCYYSLAKFYEKHNDPEKAEKAYKGLSNVSFPSKGLECYGNFPLASFYVRQGKIDNAEMSLKMCKVNLILAGFYEKNDLINKAEYEYIKATESDYPKYTLLLIKFYERNNRITEARKLRKEALKRFPQDASIFEAHLPED